MSVSHLTGKHMPTCQDVSFELRKGEVLGVAGLVGSRRTELLSTIYGIMAAGGGARSPVWRQIKADILGAEIVPSLQDEPGAMGSAILGLAAVTGETDRLALAGRFVRHGEPVKPNAEFAAYYRGQYALYKQLRAFSVAHTPR